MKAKLIIILMILCICSTCQGQERQIPICWNLYGTLGDFVELYEVTEDTVILDTLETIAYPDTIYILNITADNERHYFAAKGFLSGENVWSPFSNVIDTFLIKSPTLWFKKK